MAFQIQVWLLLSLRCLSLIAVTLFLAESAAAWWMWTPGDTVDNVGHKPKQPIPFNHQRHSDEHKIPCEYCHASARRSPVAGIPPLNTCMGCHKFVATAKDPIKFIAARYQANQPVKWTKVHDLPDFVRFSHQVHVLAKLSCQECHGKVEKMGVAVQKAPLQMGWCVDCHRQKKASIACLTCHY